MSTKDKSPLTARCDSSGSDDVPDRNSPSPYSMLSNQMNGSNPYDHHYASPNDLKNDIAIEMERIDKNDSRKKRNLIYESVNTKDNGKIQAKGKLDKNSNGFLPPPRSQNSDSDEALIVESVKGTKRSRTLLCLVISVFVLSLVAVSLAVIAFISRGVSGVSPVATNGRSSTDKNYLIDHTDTKDTKEIHLLRNNFTHLHDHVIPKLEAKIDALTKKLEETAIQGPMGPAGPPGPAGAGDLSKCEYDEKPKSNSVGVRVSLSGTVTETEGYKIMAATCSQDGADVAVLKTELDSNLRRQYYCKCGGTAQADAFKSKNGYITCRIHYWKCPSRNT